MPLRQDFTSPRNFVDSTSPLQRALTNVQATFANMEAQEEDKRRFEENLLMKKEDMAESRRRYEEGRALQLKADARAEASAAMIKAEHDLKIKEDKELGELLRGLSSDKTKTVESEVTTTTPGVLTAGEKEGLGYGRANLVDKLTGLEKALKVAEEVTPEIKSETKTEVGNFTGEISPSGIPLREGESALPGREYKEPTFMQRGTRGSGEKPLLETAYNSEYFADDTTIPMSASSNVGKAAKEDAKILEETKAKKDSLLKDIEAVKGDLSLYDTLTKDVTKDVTKDRTTTKTSKKSTDIELDKESWIANETAKLAPLSLGGVATVKAQDTILKRADKLFPDGSKYAGGTYSKKNPDGSITSIKSRTLEEEKSLVDNGYTRGAIKNAPKGAKGNGTTGIGKSVSEDPKGWDTIKEAVTSWAVPRSEEESYIANLSSELDTLQELTGLPAASIVPKINDLVSVAGPFGLIGRGKIDPGKVNRLYRNKIIDLDGSVISIGEALTAARETDTDGNRRLLISTNSKGRTELVKNPTFKESKVLK